MKIMAVELRNWVDEKSLAYDEEERRRKEIERKKEREAKMKLQNEFAKVVLINNGAPLSVLEHQEFVSKIKAEVAQTLEDNLFMIKENQKSNVIRLESILLDGHGCKFWELRGHSDENTQLLQVLL